MIDNDLTYAIIVFNLETESSLWFGVYFRW